MLLREIPTERLTLYTASASENPVDWQEWGETAFDEARRRDVPIFLSVGYAACHWCHVMADESFEDPLLARELNTNFVPIKVDREARPDVDSVYMAATTALTGRGGWPMSVWLDHEGRAFYAGTYFPDVPRHGMPAFSQVLEAVSDAWRDRRPELLESAARINDLLSERTQTPGPVSAVEDGQLLADAVTRLAESFDVTNAGFGSAPKFPPSMVLRFLWDYSVGYSDLKAGEMAAATCEAMARGGMFDQLAGGFARYSVDDTWTVPHFEKMLYDNALLVDVYATWFAVSGSPFARRVCTQTVEFMLQELQLPTGGFAAALDADAPPEPGASASEGASYAWTPRQLEAVLGREDGAWVASLTAVSAEGSFEYGSSVLQLLHDPEDEERWQRCREALHTARTRRPQPALDDKLVLSWNALAVVGLVRAGLLLEQDSWIAAALRVGSRIRESHMMRDPSGTGVRLARISRGGVASEVPGVLEDYALTIEALLALQRASGDVTWYEDAERLTEVMLDLFLDGEDEKGAFYDTAADAQPLVRRPREITDNASPAGNSAAAKSLISMAALSGRDDWRAIADVVLTNLAPLMQQQPQFAGWGLQGLMLSHSGPREVVVAADRESAANSDRKQLISAVERFASGRAVSASTVGDPGETIPLLIDRGVSAGTTAYVCENFACRLPVHTVAALEEQLSS